MMNSPGTYVTARDVSSTKTEVLLCVWRCQAELKCLDMDQKHLSTEGNGCFQVRGTHEKGKKGLSASELAAPPPPTKLL